MALWEISFRSQYDYPFIRMSQQFPGLPISMWCVFNRELLQVPTLDANILEGIEKHLRKSGRVVDKWVEGAAY